MHVELADLFRCPGDHEDTWLVLAADRTEARVVLDGTLGCPVCGAEYVIRDGTTHFGLPGEEVARSERAAGANDSLRLAALLNVSDAFGTVALVGADVGTARALQALVPMRCVVVDPPSDVDSAAAIAAIVTGSAPVAVLQCDGILPVSRGSLDGILVQHGDPRYMAAATVALRALGRLVAPSQAAVPSGIVELARDDLHWVGERSADSSDEITDVAGNAPLVQLRRRR